MKKVKLKEVKKDFLGRIYAVEREVLSMKEKRIYLEPKVVSLKGKILKRR